MTIHQNISPLAQGNIAIRNKDYATAIERYVYAVRETPALADTLAFNIRMAQSKYRKQRVLASRLRVALCSSAITNIAAERIHTLSSLYQDFADIELISVSDQADLSETIKKSNTITKHSQLSVTLKGKTSLNKTIDFIAYSPFDCVHIVDPCSKTLLIGVLYKTIWNTKVLTDISGSGLPEAPELIDILSDYNPVPPSQVNNNSEEQQEPSLSLTRSFDEITTYSPTIQKKLGGILIDSLGKENIPKLKHSIESTTYTSITQEAIRLIDIIAPQLSHILQTPKSHTPHQKPENKIYIKNKAEPQPTLESPPQFYKQSNSDINPLIHYATQGVNEGRQPLPPNSMDEAPTTSQSQVSSTLLDGYTLEQINKLGLFDAEWYIKEYSLEITTDEALDHYLAFGIGQEFNPSTKFNTRYYKRSNPDVVNCGANPFVHYVVQGINEGRAPLPLDLVQVSTEQKIIDQQYVPYRKVDSIGVEIPAKVICFYLPQFHAIPENDKWWGEGFTEWTNVKPAQPQFEGHYQPHEPDVLGYYNLLDPDVQKKQVELAKNYGVGGFCFYYYWFDGKRLLEKPVENYLNDKSLDLPFCLCWANENWSRRWDGLENDILIGQNHCLEDDLAFIKSLAPYLKDERYIRVDGKPLVIIYRPSLFPDPVETGKLWRQWCRENGIGEIHLALTHSFEKTSPDEYGYDSVVEFPPNNTGIPNITPQIESVNEDFAGSIYDWDTLVKRSENYTTPEYPVFRGVCPSWDNTARKKNKGSILYGSSPRRYQNWLFNAIVDNSKLWKGSDRLVFVNAWNEWAEGTHLEPDTRYGFAYLEATRNALIKASLCLDKPSFENNTLAVVVHSFYPDILEEIIERLKQTGNTQLKLFVTCPESEVSTVEAILVRSGFEHFLLSTINRGRDVLPFFKILPHIFNGHHRAILKLHTKKSKHREDGDKWRDDLYEKLISNIESAQHLFKEAPEIGMIGPEGHILPMDSYWGSNEKNVLKLAARLGVGQEQVFDLPFIAGTMFFCRTISLLPLCKLVAEEDFELEAGQADGTFAHAIERIFSILMYSLGLKMIDTENKDSKYTNINEYAFAKKG